MPRVILITGTRKGIGRDLSEYYLNKGDIVCGCSRTQSNLEHKNYRHFTLDVSDENAVVNMVRAVKKEFGTIDVLLNNAGIASMNHILTTPLKTMQNIFNTNVFGSFLFLREVSKVMVQNYKKRIKDLESKGLDSKNNAKNAIAEAVCDDFKESAILDSNNKDSTAEGFLSDFRESAILESSNSKIVSEKCGLQGKSQGSLLNINDRSDFSQLPHLSQKAEFSKVLCAVSGGVDSSVVATLLYRAIGENLIPVFVDTGLLRKGEREAVEAMFRENLKVPLIVADARELFLGRLKGVTDPEKKRKIIGETFIEVFEAEAKKHNTKGEIKFLAQGTLYPDVIESVSVKGPSKTIKSHHNVGGLPEWMKFELIEPLRELFKDEVRALGRELGMPESMLMRHPFPGPGLAIRIMGEVNAADLELLKEADSIFIEELHKWGLYDSVWQAFCVLLNVRSVGVMGDNRTYDNTICVRAVEAMDGMTASFSHLPHAFLERVSNRIINEVAGINRVVYDITSKPPGTIEWE